MPAICFGPNLQSTETDRSDAMITAEIRKILGAFCSEQEGVTAIEYALLAALIFLAILASVRLLGDAVIALFNTVAAIFPLV